MVVSLTNVVVMHLIIIKAVPFFTVKAVPSIFVTISVKLGLAELMTGCYLF
jgi:hypothetical protein